MQSWLLLGGVLVAYVGLLTPFAGRVYGMRDVDARIAYVEAHAARWRLHNAAFGVGALLVGAGLALGPWPVAALGVLGGLCGGAFALWRLLVAPATWFLSSRGGLLFWAYTALTIAAFLVAGILLLPRGVGYGLIAWNCLLVIVAAWARDVPPFLHFAGAIALGIESI